MVFKTVSLAIHGHSCTSLPRACEAKKFVTHSHFYSIPTKWFDVSPGGIINSLLQRLSENTAELLKVLSDTTELLILLYN